MISVTSLKCQLMSILLGVMDLMYQSFHFHVFVAWPPDVLTADSNNTVIFSTEMGT